jgi:hypothetical protein
MTKPIAEHPNIHHLDIGLPPQVTKPALRAVTAESTNQPKPRNEKAPVRFPGQGLTRDTAQGSFLRQPQPIRHELPKMKPKPQKPAPFRPALQPAQASFGAMLASIAMRKAAIEMDDPELDEHADALEAEAVKLATGRES